MPDLISLKSCSVARSGNVVNKMYRDGQLILQNVARKPYLDLSEDELDFQSGATSATVTVSSNMVWTASTSTPWITVTTGSSSLNIAVSENETGDERSGSITITGRNILSSITTSITVNQEYVVDYSKKYLTMRSLANNNSITFTKKSAVTTTYATSISYSTDGGSTWITTNVNSSQQTVTVSGLNNGDEVLWKGVANSWSKTGSTDLTVLCSTFSTTGNYEIEGNIMSLLYGDNFSSQTSITGENALMFLFYNSTGLTNANNLVLPATTLSVRCYRSLMQGCSSLVTPMNELPAMTLTQSCYQGMFDTCSAMTSVPALPATTLATGCYNNMFLRCRKITASPVLPAKTLVTDCYRAMFNTCVVLKHIICLAETGIGQNNSTLGWTTSVPTSSDGLFEYANGVTSWSRGTKGVPNNWKLQVYNP